MFTQSLVVHRGEASRKAPCGFLFNWVKDEESSSRLSSQRPRHRCGATAPAATPPRGALASLVMNEGSARARPFSWSGEPIFFHDLCPDRKKNCSRIYKAPAINSITFSWLLGRGRYASQYFLCFHAFVIEFHFVSVISYTPLLLQKDGNPNFPMSLSRWHELYAKLHKNSSGLRFSHRCRVSTLTRFWSFWKVLSLCSQFSSQKSFGKWRRKQVSCRCPLW